MNLTEEEIREARNKMARFCAYQERSVKEVENKLISAGVDANAIPGIIKELIREGFINEKRFVRAFCTDKFKFNKWGRYKIRQALMQHNLSQELVELGLSSIEEDEYQKVLEDLISSKSAHLTNTLNLAEKRKKIADYLIRKGFESDLVWSMVREMTA